MPFLVTTTTTTTWTSPGFACSCAMPPPLPSAPQALPRNGVIRVPLYYPHVYHWATRHGGAAKTPGVLALELRSEATGSVVPADHQLLSTGQMVAELRPREPLQPGTVLGVYTPVPDAPPRAELRVVVTDGEDRAAPRWTGPVELVYTPQGRPMSGCSSGQAGLQVRFASIQDDDTPADRLVVMFWEGSEAYPPDYTRPPAGLVGLDNDPRDRRPSVLLASDSFCAYAPLQLPSAGERPRRYGLRLADLAGNTSALVELLVTPDGVTSLTPDTRSTRETLEPHGTPRRGGCGF
jgi:hypothetical protein